MISKRFGSVEYQGVFSAFPLCLEAFQMLHKKKKQ